MEVNIANIIKEWKQEAGVKHTVLFKLKYGEENKDYVLTICTSQPGYFIGRGGKLAEKYRGEIKSKLYASNISIQFMETAPYTI